MTTTSPEEMVVHHAEGPDSVVLSWPVDEPRAVIHVLHGWGEHARRYDRPARALNEAGYAVVADDHRGHGESGRRSDTLGDLGPGGGDGVLLAVHDVTLHAREMQPDVPVVALGHSWGSFLLQRYLRRWSDEVDAAVLMGTTFRDPSAPAPAERPDRNARFEPVRTPYDWLTRDEHEVDLYIADPLCGFEMMGGSAASRATGGTSTAGPSGQPRPDLPLLILNGSDDPIGGDVGGRALEAHYRDEGLHDVTLRLYPGARHELFNETNRDEVVADLIGWLDAHCR